MSITEIERRLIALEQEIAHLKDNRLRAPGSHPINVLEQIHGTFENNDKAFRQAMRLGRQWRQSTRPKAGKAKRG